ncbi:FAD-dependent oxidoreductase [Rufibacter sp. DG15C]|uniref:glycerol-3-phosphate dehydrogenase/oxidase n=1 Tax=Rufibacter sp. DG15C TaxID=1379909 RepID=UPI00078B8A9D|nr:glycerol-3-phosphate dehydrogenase/oxidase [Rufibacter sp. DG15C]AMM50418.1 FAD-dependent oxidoreductase [Rufibacter sp. DG15C]
MEESQPFVFNREHFLRKVQEETVWDVVVIGGGATGLGIAVDAASRGYKTLLLEQADFAKGTSSRSTKLVHGGVRYLALGHIKLVLEALRERGRLLQNAPHLVTIQSFIIPTFSWWDKLVYGLGLTLYDLMAGRLRLRRTAFLSAQETAQQLPNIKTKGLTGGVQYFDGQFDDTRLAINLAQTCAEQGGLLLNYMPVVNLLKDARGKVIGVTAQDIEFGQEYVIQAKTVINATGVFVNSILHMDAPAQQPLVRPSQGVHVVLDQSFLKGENALMIPKTSDGRVLFMVPWHGYLLVGTTDTLVNETSLEPKPQEQEIDFILETASHYLARKPTRADVLSVFAGQRPLAAPTIHTHKTKEISRSHSLLVAPSGLITVTGGKWTTYRQMAEDAIDLAITKGFLLPLDCQTAQLKIHGYTVEENPADPLAIYGTDKVGILALVQQFPDLGIPLHPNFSHIAAEVVWAAQYEMARTVEDVLARRLRVLFLDARAALEMAPKVAQLMAVALHKDAAWEENQIHQFTQLASQYIL